MVKSNREEFKYKSEWRRRQERKEFEKYNIKDGALMMMVGSAITTFIVLSHALKSLTGYEPFPNIIPYVLGIGVLSAVNAFGIMLIKQKRMGGDQVELLTILALILWTWYNVTHIIG
ncbi:hypothetical protein ACWA2C_28155 [Priestia megaterium]